MTRCRGCGSERMLIYREPKQGVEGRCLECGTFRYVRKQVDLFVLQDNVKKIIDAGSMTVEQLAEASGEEVSFINELYKDACVRESAQVEGGD